MFPIVAWTASRSSVQLFSAAFPTPIANQRSDEKPVERLGSTCTYDHLTVQSEHGDSEPGAQRAEPTAPKSRRGAPVCGPRASSSRKPIRIGSTIRPLWNWSQSSTPTSAPWTALPTNETRFQSQEKPRKNSVARPIAPTSGPKTTTTLGSRGRSRAEAREQRSRYGPRAAVRWRYDKIASAAARLRGPCGLHRWSFRSCWYAAAWSLSGPGEQ